jgi:transmembrane sensor
VRHGVLHHGLWIHVPHAGWLAARVQEEGKEQEAKLEGGSGMSGDKDDVRISAAAREASRWLMRLEREPHNQGDFDEWLREHPSHAREFLEMTWLDVELGQSGPGGTLESAELIRQARASAAESLRCSSESVEAQKVRVRKDTTTADPNFPADGNVIWLGGPRDPQMQRRFHPMTRLRAPARALALTCLVVLVAAFLLLHPHDYVYATAAGEEQVFVLSDGSRLHLNAQSRVVARFRRTVRELELLEGEALFAVAHEAARPFRVFSRGAAAEALGTQFGVKLDSDDLLVTVMRGRVTVSANRERASDGSSIELSHGEQVALHVGRDRGMGPVHKLTVAESRAAIAWTDSIAFLPITGTPLRELVSQINDSNVTQILIDDQTIGEVQMGGTFSLLDPEGFARALRLLGIAGVRADPGADAALHLVRITRNEQGGPSPIKRGR